MHQLVIGEAVPVDLRVARVGSRTVVAILDTLLCLAATFVVLGVLRPVLAASDDALQVAINLIVLVGIWVGYPVAAETSWNGRTLGKAAMGVRVVRDDGGPVRFRHALVRALIWFLVEMPILFIPILTSMVSSRAKRVGDLLAGTVVIQERVPKQPVSVPPMPPALAGWAATLDLARLTNELALSARSFLGRAHQLSPPAREHLGGQMVALVQAVVTPPPPPGTPGWAYLAAVLQERRRREELRLGVAQTAGPGRGVPSAPVGSVAPPAAGSGPFAPVGSVAPPAAGPGPLTPAAGGLGTSAPPAADRTATTASGDDGWRPSPGTAPETARDDGERGGGPELGPFARPT
ncbi:MAG: RDD family protein [Frankiaceae bacterium]